MQTYMHRADGDIGDSIHLRASSRVREQFHAGGVSAGALADRGVRAWNGTAMCLPAGGAGGIVQAKLQVNRPGDRYEQEADRVADAVVGGGAAPVAGISALDGRTTQRKCAECEKEDEQTAQRKETSGGGAGVNAAAAVEQGTSGGGESIPAGERDVMESRIGADFGAVRIHRDGSAASAARALNARAFTVGRDVVFGAGEYQPGTHAGRRLLAHELTHVVQQRGSGTMVQRATARATVQVRQPDASVAPRVVLAQVHGDEYESLDVAKDFVEAKKGVILIYIARTGDNGKRCVAISDAKNPCSIDPNRMLATPYDPPLTQDGMPGATEPPVGENHDAGGAKDRMDWIAPKISQTCTPACTTDDTRGAVRAFRDAFINEVNKARRTVLESGNAGETKIFKDIDDVPVFFMHTNDNNGSTTVKGFQKQVNIGDAKNPVIKNISAKTFRPRMEAKKGARKQAFAEDTDDFVFLTSLVDYLNFTGDSVLRILKPHIKADSPLAPELTAAEATPETATRAALVNLYQHALADKDVTAALNSTELADMARAMIVARLFNVILQAESNEDEFNSNTGTGVNPVGDLYRDGSASVYYRNARFFNLETESKKGGWGAEKNHEKAPGYAKSKQRYARHAELLLLYFGA